MSFLLGALLASGEGDFLAGSSLGIPCSMAFLKSIADIVLIVVFAVSFYLIGFELMIEFTERGVKGSRQVKKGSISQNLVRLFDIFAEDPVYFGIVDLLADKVVCLIEKMARS